jgi:hypothetical protein
MAWGKTEEQKAVEAQQQAIDAQRQAEAQWWASPVGLATAAKQRGDGFFHLEVEMSRLKGGASAFGSSQNKMRTIGGRPDFLGQIEQVGWRLEHVGYVFVETGSTSTNRVISTGQGVVTRGVVQGMYLFRNTD